MSGRQPKQLGRALVDKGDMRIVLLTLVIAACGLAVARPAHACGIWHLHERGRSRTADFYVESVTRRGEGGLVRILGHHPGMRLVERDGTVLTVENGVLRRDGQRVGTVQEGVLTIGRRSWTIRVARRPEGAPGPDIYRWTVEVRRDGERVAHADRAMAFCKCGHCDEEQERLDVLCRTALYLAWRALP